MRLTRSPRVRHRAGPARSRVAGTDPAAYASGTPCSYTAGGPADGAGAGSGCCNIGRLSVPLRIRLGAVGSAARLDRCADARKRRLGASGRASRRPARGWCRHFLGPALAAGHVGQRGPCAMSETISIAAAEVSDRSLSSHSSGSMGDLPTVTAQAHEDSSCPEPAASACPESARGWTAGCCCGRPRPPRPLR